MSNVIHIDQARNQRRGGRPRKLPEELRTYIYQVGLTKHENNIICERAESVGLPPHELIRKLTLNQRVNTVPMVNREALVELNKIGNNLNQLTKAANSGALPQVSADEIRSF